MYDLSILMPGIRTQFWEDIYNKFEKYLTKNSWELVIVGPYSLPKELESKRNIKYVKDFGSPIRCQQIGLILSEGEFITWTSDDGVPLEGALEEAFYDLNEGTILSGKYYEGEGTDHIMSNPGYYLLGNNGMMRGLNVPLNSYVVNTGLIRRQNIVDLGGWDCINFEGMAMAHSDLAVRFVIAGFKIEMFDKVMYRCTHMPDRTGDHGPMHDAQAENDEPNFRKLYSITGRPAVIDINTWRRSPSIWERRFSV